MRFCVESCESPIQGGADQGGLTGAEAHRGDHVSVGVQPGHGGPHLTRQKYVKTIIQCFDLLVGVRAITRKGHGFHSPTQL